MRRSWIVFVGLVLAGCTEHGSTPSGATADAPISIGFQTGPFHILVCTSGLPDDPPSNPNPNCPVNRVSLDAIGVHGTLEMVVRPNLTTLPTTLIAGPNGLHAVDPRILVGDVLTFDFATLDVAANSSVSVDARPLVPVDITQTWNVVFDTLEPLGQ